MSQASVMDIRLAAERDLPRIVEIYNAAVPSRRSTADTETVTPESRREWFHRHEPQRRPLLVGEDQGDIVAWMSFEDFYGRPAYAHTAELSIYIAPEYQGRLLGKRLLQRAEALAPSLDIHTLVGYLFAHNTPSLRLLRASGYQEWGRLLDVARMDGRDYSLCIMGKRLEGAPAPLEAPD
ncbi:MULTISPECIES: GNAT family N-acetyltransferase [Halomonas]|uniref:Phosphinothricin acetyltransferase n=1 Tax=Halomonas halophila TaxID=29573 RepID=A0ABQ0U0T2_9GAMM|nr:MULTISPECIES: GNAT family N-acetyltransferase [Halomonas]MDR5888626.1 GNAT family N-acetyltransferase [Halomonas salina]WJY07807.1 N-acetyltransferase family protein [Halomonas halophila]GEK72012.1 phosphinothricin acetyltransferase [Halomonas halophila]